MSGAALLGVLILVAGQGLIEHVFAFSTTISVFINVYGGLYFIYLILKLKSN
jgi:iron complex transport system permease protein